ncbi:MAG: hypothetical protein ACYTBJ_05435 [Planctomycetota bacterium]|jgi:hypothetical protein
MPSIFGRYFEVVPKASPWDSHGEDILGYAMDNIAKDMQTRLRSRIDTGSDIHAALRARTVTVRASDGRLEIRAQETDDEPQEDTQISDLFHASKQNHPFVENGKMIFRQIREKEISRKNLEAVKSSLEDSLKLNLSRHIEDGVRRVKSENSELLK